MSKASAKKICIVVMSLGGGGAERSSALLSVILDNLGYEVHIVSVLNTIEYNFKGTLLNLGELKDKNDSVFGRFNRLKVLKKYLREQGFDYIIDNRTRIGFFKELIISKWLYKANKTVYCVRSYETASYLNSNKFLGRLMYASAYKIVAVSDAISEKLKTNYKFNNIEVIYNPVDIETESNATQTHIEDVFILFYGRINDDIKNISLLLEAYAKSKLPESNIKLKILGKGKDESLLKNKSEKLGLETKVEFLNYRSNPLEIVKSAFFTVLTSRYEGLPRVLVESLVIGTPVVSVDCKSGPSEIIINEQNGLLVENHNPDALAKAMNRMLEDKDLYLHCKSNAKPSVEKFSKENVGQQWKALLK